MDTIKTAISFKDSGTRTDFGTGAVRDGQKGKGRMDLVPYLVVWLISRIYEDGAIKYAENNWMQGIPVKQFVKSAMNHLSKYMEGMRDEPHLSMAGWNIMCAIWTASMVQLGVFPPALGELPVPGQPLTPHEIESLRTFYGGAKDQPPEKWAVPMRGVKANVGLLPEQRGHPHTLSGQERPT